jgi:hypothetical protein
MYKLTPISTLSNTVNSIIRLADGACIPVNTDNTDYQNYLKWLDGYELQGRDWVKTSDGNTPEPADE